MLPCLQEAKGKEASKSKDTAAGAKGKAEKAEDAKDSKKEDQSKDVTADGDPVKQEGDTEMKEATDKVGY